MNKEIKRRSRVIGIFPNNAAIVGRVGTLLAEQTDEWLLARRHMSREVLAKVVVRDEKGSLPAIGKEAAYEKENRSPPFSPLPGIPPFSPRRYPKAERLR